MEMSFKAAGRKDHSHIAMIIYYGMPVVAGVYYNGKIVRSTNFPTDLERSLRFLL